MVIVTNNSDIIYFNNISCMRLEIHKNLNSLIRIYSVSKFREEPPVSLTLALKLQRRRMAADEGARPGGNPSSSVFLLQILILGFLDLLTFQDS